MIFRVTPYYENIARALLKEPKYYFYDCARVENNNGAKLENIVANALIKELHYMEDIFGSSTKLHFLKTRNGKELDFLIVINNKPVFAIEVKWSDDNPSDQFHFFEKYFPQKPKMVQLVKEIKREKTFQHGLEIRSLIPWLANIDFESMCQR